MIDGMLQNAGDAQIRGYHKFGADCKAQYTSEEGGLDVLNNFFYMKISIPKERKCTAARFSP